MDKLHRCFPPVFGAQTRLLLLGSLPGPVALQKQQYYGQPRNQFWRLVSAVIGRDLVLLDYEARLAALLEAGIGLWDTVAAARRRTALDTDIRLEATSDLNSLVDRLPELRAVGFNGGLSAKLGRRQLEERPGLALIDLPSSSPALTTPFERKLESWLRLRDYL
ncbi:MAG: DNA-deoxyinosine glycosylase [Sphingosinicella sp.]